MEQSEFRSLLARTIALPIVILLALGALFSASTYYIVRNVRSVETLDEQVNSIRHLNRLFVDVDSDLRGYLITGHEEFLEPFNNSQHEVDRELRQLRTSSDKPKALASAWQDWKQQALESIDLRRQKPDRPTRQTPEARRLMEKIEVERENLLEVALKEHDSVVERARTATRMTYGTVAISTVLAGLLLAMYTRRHHNALLSSFSQQIRAKEANAQMLQEVSEQKTLVLEAAEIGTWDYRVATGALVWDEKCREQFGVTGGDESSYEVAMAQILPTDRRRVTDALNRASRGENAGTYRTEFRTMQPDGSVRWINSIGRAYFEGEGKNRRVTHIVGANIDVTARKTAEEELRYSENLLRTVTENARVGMVVLNADRRYVFANTGYQQMLGVSAQQIIGKHVSEVVGPRYEEIRPLLDKAFAGERASYELPVTRPDGTARILHVTYKLQTVGAEQKQVVVTVSDITEVRAAQQEVQENEKRLRSVLENLSEGIVISDPQGMLESWNRAALDLHGFQSSEEAREPLSTFAEKFEVHTLDGELVPITEWPLMKILRGELLRNWDLCLHHKELGWKRFLSYGGMLLRNAKGEPWIAILTITDIHERTMAVKALTESEQQFRELASTIPQLAWVAEPDGSISWYNPQWYSYTGTTPETMKGWGWQSVHDPKTLPEVVARWKTTLETGEPFHMVFPLRGADGVFRPFLTLVRPLRNAEGQIVRWFGTNTDISEQLRVEEALRRSEERWATTLRSIGEAVISTDSQQRIVFMNHAAEKLTAWPIEEAMGLPLNQVLRTVDENTHVEVERSTESLVAAQTPNPKTSEAVLIRRDGSERFIQESAAPIRTAEDGSVSGFVLVCQDVTERRRVEKVLRDNERLATTGRLAASIAHEIHNPLDSVANLLFMLSHSPDAETSKEFIEMATNELQRVTQITRHMLAFQREATKSVDIDISELIRNVLGVFESKITRAEIEIRTRIEFDRTFKGLPGEIRQVLANLIGNAMEAVGRGGRIAIHARAGTDWQSCRTGLRVYIADNGPGIPAEAAKRILEPFFTTKGESGTGLGLWITSGIVEKYKGVLRFRTQRTEGASGTCFSVFLPF